MALGPYRPLGQAPRLPGPQPPGRKLNAAGIQDVADLGQGIAGVTQVAPGSVRTASGVSAQARNTQQGIALLATLPAGPLLPLPVMFELVGDSISAQTQAASVPVTRTPDGLLYVKIDPTPGAPLVVFDPQSLSYGVASEHRFLPDGTRVRDLRETIHADQTRTITHNSRTRGTHRSYDQVSFDHYGRMSATHVEGTNLYGLLVNPRPQGLIEIRNGSLQSQLIRPFSTVGPSLFPGLAQVLQRQEKVKFLHNELERGQHLALTGSTQQLLPDLRRNTRFLGALELDLNRGTASLPKTLQQAAQQGRVLILRGVDRLSREQMDTVRGTTQMRNPPGYRLVLLSDVPQPRLSQVLGPRFTAA